MSDAVSLILRGVNSNRFLEVLVRQFISVLADFFSRIGVVLFHWCSSNGTLDLEIGTFRVCL